MIGVDSAIIGEQMVRSQPAGRPTRRGRSYPSKPVHILGSLSKRALVTRTTTRLRPTFNGPQEIAAQMSVDRSPDLRSRLPQRLAD